MAYCLELSSLSPIELYVHLLCFCVDELYRDHQECPKVETIRKRISYPVSKHTPRVSGMVPTELMMMCRNGLSLIYWSKSVFRNRNLINVIHPSFLSWTAVFLPYGKHTVIAYYLSIIWYQNHYLKAVLVLLLQFTVFCRMKNMHEAWPSRFWEF